MIAVLKEHEHVIDCVKWAPYDACVSIDLADYNKNSMAAGAMGQELVNENGDADESNPLEEQKLAE